MAPSPQHDDQPKAPDKNVGAAAQSNEARSTLAPTPPNAQVSEGKQVDGLDDGQLRALLDEAITYKCPKDREGKSLLFKELLEEAEQDEKERSGGASGSGGGRERGARHKRRGERGLPHASSLQDLVAAALADVASQRRRPAAPVSARTHHGGSLPSGVDRSFLMGEEPVRSGAADYIATVRCVNPPPLADRTERRVSVSDAVEMEVLGSKASVGGVTYTSRATLDINSGGAGRALTTTTCSNQVDSGITFGCITTPAVVASCNTTASAPAPCASVDSKPRMIPTTINGLAGIRSYGAAGSSAADDFKKSLDENGNQTSNSPLSGSSQHKTAKKKGQRKSSKNETVAMSEQIDGYQGNKELSELLRFIESDVEHGRSHKHKHHHDDDKAAKKRSTERRKDKGDKIKRANSMEELSLTKLEDLSHEKGKGDLSLRKHKKERVSDGGDARKNERRSWGDESGNFYSEEPQQAAPKDKKAKTKQNKAAEWPQVAQDVPVEPPIENLEFQTVTKKKRTRKRHSPHATRSGGGGSVAGDLYRKLRAPASPDRRRKSAPPSDKSNDSNDDLDSVHSLPAEPTAERCAVRPGSASSGGTPQASYADIARSAQRNNIPDLIESCNFYTDVQAPVQPEEKPAGKKEVCRSDSAPAETRNTPPKVSDDAATATYDAENYPALETRHRTLPRTKQDSKSVPANTKERRTKVHSESSIEKPSEKLTDDRPKESSDPPDVVSDRRPAVILLDEESRPREMDGITFGFDINEQLLNGGSEHKEEVASETPLPFPSSDEFPAINEKRPRVRIDLVRDVRDAVSVRVGRAALRYLPPAPLASSHATHLQKLANYVGAAWEDIMKCPGGKVRYFSQ